MPSPSDESSDRASAGQAPITGAAQSGAQSSIRTGVLMLVAACALAMQFARIAHVESTSGEVPFLSANDRSRWCTIEALVSQGSYEIDSLLFRDDDPRRRSAWYSIGLVRHRGSDGQQHYYSSKPPLLPTLYAGVYGMVSSVTGWSLQESPFLVARTILVLVNLLPLGVFLFCFLRWHQTRTAGAEDAWGSVALALFVAFGTFLTTFTNTLNNHLPAAMAVAGSVWCLHRVLVHRDPRWRWFVLCGVCTSFGAANELPALGWVVAAGGALLICFPLRTVCGYVPALLPVALAFFGTNYLAHQDWRPAYAHRDVGERLFDFDIAPDATYLEPQEVIQAFHEAGVRCSVTSEIRPARRPNTFALLDLESQQQYGLVLDDASRKITVHQWGDWYDYPGSYWAGEKQGVDRGEPSRPKYIFHSLLGHHGIFSLTPFWLLLPLGVIAIWRERTSNNLFRDGGLLVLSAVLATSVIVIGFYLARGLEDRNYGGVTSGFRWAFWLIPLWLWISSYSVVSLRSNRGRQFAGVLIAVSVFSATYPWNNPWTSPWLMQMSEALGFGF